MTRQNYFVNTTTKNIDVETSFGSGMNTQAHPEKLRDDESTLIENADLYAGGVVRARGAYSQTNAPSTAISGNVQGHFRYENTAGGQDLVAINGQLYTISGNTYTKLTITGMSSFQSTRPIESTQYNNMMYFATGSGIVTYDGVTAKALVAYAPNGLEALYIGTNGYASNPDSYLSDMTNGVADLILGLVPDQRYAQVNKNVLFTAYIESISTDSLEYQWEVKKVIDADYPTTPAVAWGNHKTWTANFATAADYMIRCSMRKVGTTAVLSQYVLPKYSVMTTPDTKPEPDVNFADLSTCNRIFVHYDRLVIYGSTVNPNYIYVSELNNFAYFPRTHTITINDPLSGKIQSIAKFRTYLVIFTNGSLQMMTGQAPSDYVVSSIHTALGTIYPYSIQVMRNNYLVFCGNDFNIYILKPIRATSMMMDVQRCNENIRDMSNSLLQNSIRVLSCIYNNQYYLYIEGSSTHYIYRYYYDNGLWVRDNLSFPLAAMDCIDNARLFGTGTDGKVYQLKQGVFSDGTNTTFTMRITSKDFDFTMPHHRKKLKQFQLLCDMTAVTQPQVSLYVDNTLVSTTTLQYDILQNSDAQKLKIMASGRFRYLKVDIQIPVKEAVEIIGMAFVYKLNTPK